MGELIVNGIKIALLIAIAGVFLVAINTLLNLLSSVIFANVAGEILGVISCCLPFDASLVFSSVGAAISAILAFLVAQKIYNLTSGHLTI